MIKEINYWSVIKLILLVLMIMPMSTCTQDNIMDDDPCFNTISVNFDTTEILSDICEQTATDTTCSYINDTISLTISNDRKNLSIQSSVSLDVELTKIEVFFVRRDEGTQVPQPISHEISELIKIDSSLGYSLTVVTHRMKMEPPISDLRELGYDHETGNSTIETDAHIVFTGRNRAGCKIIYEAKLPVIFADFADE